MIALAALAIVALAHLGCAPASKAPFGMLPDIRQAGADPYGAWATVTWHDGRESTVSGELITVTDERLLLLNDTTWTEVRTGAIQRFAVEPYRGHVEELEPYSRLSRGVNAADLRKLARFARFPAGLPSGIDRRTLRSRPVPPATWQ